MFFFSYSNAMVWRKGSISSHNTRENKVVGLPWTTRPCSECGQEIIEQLHIVHNKSKKSLNSCTLFTIRARNRWTVAHCSRQEQVGARKIIVAADISLFFIVTLIQLVGFLPPAARARCQKNEQRRVFAKLNWNWWSRFKELGLAHKHTHTRGCRGNYYM